MHQAISLHARIRADWSPIRQWSATGAKTFATATRTEILSICWVVAHDGDSLSRLLGIRIAWSRSPTCRMDQNSPIWIQAADIIDEAHITFGPISLLHIPSFAYQHCCSCIQNMVSI